LPEPLNEFERIARLVAGLPRGEGVIVGPGDDAAVLRPRDGRDLVVTTDTFVEGRHFRRDVFSTEEAGARLAAANLSDLAAMAALPRWALVALVAPHAWDAADVERFHRSLATTLAADGVAIVGGNLSSGDGPFTATVTLLGEVGRDAAWTRAGAREGDVLAVTGHPGSAAAFLSLALWGNPPSRDRVPPALAARIVAPPSRVAFARALAGERLVRAAVDVSDGLSADLAHLCAASGVGARLEASELPADEPLRAAARTLSAAVGQERGPLPAGEGELLTYLQIGPGDDYELLLALDPAGWDRAAAVARELDVPLSRIGTFLSGQRLEIAARTGEIRPLHPHGWDHFAS